MKKNKKDKNTVGNAPVLPVEFPEDFLNNENPLVTFVSEEIKSDNPAEAELFARHEGIPAHHQGFLSTSKIVFAGAGGLNSWVAVALARSGAGSLTIIDYDIVEISNLPRQFFFEKDLGQPKAIRLAENLVSQAVGGTTITGIALPFEEAIEKYAISADIFVVGVDNNTCRLAAVREAKQRGIPAVFTMLSLDGMRCHCFLQEVHADAACLWCALPDLEPNEKLRCASAIVSSCMLASSYTQFFVYRALMGWDKISPFNWREADLSGIGNSKIGYVKKRHDCSVCKNL